MLDLQKNKGIMPSPPGIWINGVVYRFLTDREEYPSIYLKSEDGGACVFTSGKLVIIGVYSKGKSNPKKCNKVVEELGLSMLKAKY